MEYNLPSELVKNLNFGGEASEFLIKKWLEDNPSHDAKRVTEGIGTIEELYGG